MSAGHHRRGVQRIGLQVLGWVLVLAGIPMLVLPGPGLLALAGGLAVLAQQNLWARKVLQPVKDRAVQAATEGVSTRARIAASCLGALTIMAVGIVWILRPPPPAWWPLAEGWWLPGGVATGTTLIVSSLIALGIIVYSIRRFRPR